MSKERKNMISTEELYQYMDGAAGFPEEIGTAKIRKEKSRNDVLYYRWDLSFTKDTDAKKCDNAGMDEVQIIFNLNQDIEWQVGEDPASPRFQKVIMKRGEVCIYRNDNIGTSMFYPSGRHYQFRSLQMKTSRFSELLHMLFPKGESDRIEKLVFARVMKTRITPEMSRILSEIDSADRYAEFKDVYLETKMIELTAQVLFGIVNGESANVKKEVYIDPQDRLSVEHLREKIQLVPYDDYSAPNIAKSLAMSLSKLNRLFRMMYDTSLHAYVQEMRLEYAASLLCETRMNVSEAAIRAGYNNMSYFSKSFRERFGMSPKEYRERKVLENDL
ncbi:MAG: helix-turn-helix transcriptional regulator [Clostridiales bacterium]|nr:helix-turn-helix transcriptional regulator [Clostridiales bacterium]